MSGKVYPLAGNQFRSVDPMESVWLSASAGTGKTQVLSARVLRLLLQADVAPSEILCLTFTKAGVAEMASRVNEVLANWVRMPDELLAQDLLSIGARVDDETRARARSLFASVLDCPGGGLRIDTIHAFSQWLLSAFPEEAGLAPGTRAMEDRDRDLLAQKVLADMLLEWEKLGEADLLNALAGLSLRMGPGGARSWLMQCASARQAWFGPGGWPDDLENRLRALLGLPDDGGPGLLAEMCEDGQFATESLRQCLQTNVKWGTKTAQTSIEAIEGWLAAAPAERVGLCPALGAALFTQKGDPRALKSLEKIAADYGLHAAAVQESLIAISEFQTLLDLVAWLVPALRVGRRFALRWEDAKTREGLIDFDDQIRRAAALLNRSDMADWIAYKLDRRFDHILVDEAQDTNVAQWSIVKALAGDYFAGKGQHDDKMRTIFVVGDYKQAIFRFQGTSPENFEQARRFFREEMAAAYESARGLQDGIDARPLRDLGLDRSYRTAQPVLDFVDRAMDAIGPENFGLSGGAEPHRGDARPGEVVLWHPVPARAENDEAIDEPDEQGWISPPERRMADRIAEQIADWMEHGYPLVKGSKRRAGPGDIMVLVRKRRELASLIVARLYARGIPVAGVDRLRLGAPLAVRDLMAALRFAAQPGDSLSLACLLVSPLIGWSQEELLEHGYRDDKIPLWDHIRASSNSSVQQTAELLRGLLRRADIEPIQALLHWLLVGPWQGRRKIIARLGREANDPVDELLNAAQAYDGAHTSSLPGFIQWFDAGDGELKREAGAGADMVRVMTVHGSKGLQAPIVILADATGNPDTARTGAISLVEANIDGNGETEIPIPALRGEESVGPIADAKAKIVAEERQEHWRLLYVAMTRAEEALFIGGALGQRESEPAPDSWYARLAPLFEQEGEADPIWGERLTFGKRAEDIDAVQTEPSARPRSALPEWAVKPVGPEPEPPRPLAPSSAGDDLSASPPLTPEAAVAAARRGTLIHKLLERLPEIPADKWIDRASDWLKRHADDLREADRLEICNAAISVLSQPEFAAIFGPDSMAEVPLAATVDGQVIAGTVDRLLVESGQVSVVDFKTTRRPPSSLEDMPAGTLRQMRAYAAALEQIFPEREIRAAVLYTQAPQLIAIPLQFLEAGK